jgi:hypothetical protein
MMDDPSDRIVHTVHREHLHHVLVDMGLTPEDARGLMKEPVQARIKRVENPKTGEMEDQVVYEINPAARGAVDVFATRVNGEDRYVFFNGADPRAARMVTALKNLDADSLGRAMGMAATVTRYFAAINTQYNPVFGAFNFLRDMQGAAIQVSNTPLAGKRAEILAGAFPALKGIYTSLRADTKGKTAPMGEWAKLWDEFQQEGGQTGFRDQFSRSDERAEALQSELNQIREGKAKKAGRAIFNWLSDYNDAMENALRLSAYKAGLDKGLSKQEAASVAKNLTVNFNRKGQIGVQANALYAFFNAAVQGTARLIQTMGRMENGKFRLTKAGKTIGQIAIELNNRYMGSKPPNFKIGGLGTLMQPTLYEVWVRIQVHYCSNHHTDIFFFCWVIDETKAKNGEVGPDQRLYVASGHNANLQTVFR